MIDFAQCDCKNCIHSHDKCLYRESCERLLPKLEEVDELHIKEIKNPNRPFSKPKEVRMPFNFKLECMWFKVIPVKEHKK